MGKHARPVVVAYVSGHGFGHFTRSSLVLERVARHATVHLRTSERALALGRGAAWATTVTEVDVGPGLVQRGPLAVDVAATAAALERHFASWPARIEAEAHYLRAVGARLVFADVPPIAFAAAARAGVPSIGLGNFSWSWIYRGYAGEDPRFTVAAERLAEAEAQATQFLALEMGGGLEVFPRRVAVPPLYRPARGDRAAIRARLRFDDPRDARPIVLLSFGGFGDALDVTRVANPAHRLLVVSAPLPRESAHVRAVVPSSELPHHDLVAAVDCVIGKPGYGTVSECLARPTPLCFVPRGPAHELPALVAAVERWLPNAALAPQDLLHGEWAAAVDRALASRPREVAPPGDDGAIVAGAILGFLR